MIWLRVGSPSTPSFFRFHHSPASVRRLYAERPKYALAWNAAQAPLGWRHLPRFPIPESVARELFPVDDKIQPWDELTYLRYPPNFDLRIRWAEHPRGAWSMHTNSLGMRENREPLAKKPDLRILVTGDSHTDGVCNNIESFPHVLRTRLSEAHPGKVIEALNAAKGSFTFYNYLGTLEKFLYLEPDVFVVAVYGPNDFGEMLTPFHYFEGTDRKPGAGDYHDLVERAVEIDRAWLAQDGLSLKFFQHYPDEIAVAVKAAEEAVLDIQELCGAHGIQLVFVYIPGLFDTSRLSGRNDPELVELSRKLYAAIQLAPVDLTVHDRMANELIAFLAERGIPVLDARSVFAGKGQRFFWLEDHHIDLAAHSAIGEALAPIIEELHPAGLR